MARKRKLTREAIARRIAYEVEWPEAIRIMRCGGSIEMTDRMGNSFDIVVIEGRAQMHYDDPKFEVANSEEVF